MDLESRLPAVRRALGLLSLAVFGVMLVFAIDSTYGAISSQYERRHLITDLLPIWSFTLPLFRAYAIHRNRYVIPSIAVAALCTGYFFIGALMILPEPELHSYDMLSLFMVINLILTAGLLAELRSRIKARTLPWLEIGLSCLMFILPFSVMLWIKFLSYL